ncbi:MAG TPA: PIN domain-containing protein [Acetobacteraceae bacterium]|nr:PIN domain-containing protein [Acetobacteraceae bacterium]
MSGERFTLDTNVLVYSVDDAAPLRCHTARGVLARAASRDCHFTLQSISEFFAVVTRKKLVPAAEAAAQVSDWLDVFPTATPSKNAVRAALALSVAGQASYWDGLLLATAAEAGCTAILTEDMADGAMLHGLRIVNPFAAGGLSAEAERLLGGAR